MQQTRRLYWTPFAALLAVWATGHTALAENIVKVSLWDKGPTAMDMVGMHARMGMAMAGADMSMATMGITLDPQEIRAGDVTFKVTNDSGEFYHEMVISPVADPTRPLPYLDQEKRVDEEVAGRTAEQRELKAHSSGTLKATLTPGTYILYCNIAGHYALGMWTLLTVTE